jgi:lipopolysaccharide-induced tumor necrosis factor-alpha factor
LHFCYINRLLFASLHTEEQIYVYQRNQHLKMSYPTTNDAVSPQVTGTTNTGTFHETPNPSYMNHNSNGIEAAPAQSPAPAYNEKVGHANADAQYPMATPQQEHVNASEAKGHYAAEQQQAQGKPRYQTVTPLGSLTQGAAPVDCPVCGVREMTKTEFVSGGTTQ